MKPCYGKCDRCVWKNNGGSTIHFGHWSGVESENEYQGQEYDWIFIDEATQFTEREFRYIGGCLRGVNDIPKRMYIGCSEWPREADDGVLDSDN